jgi:hypothetical protein
VQKNAPRTADNLTVTDSFVAQRRGLDSDICTMG